MTDFSFTAGVLLSWEASHPRNKIIQGFSDFEQLDHTAMIPASTGILRSAKPLKSDGNWLPKKNIIIPSSLLEFENYER
jgi:hypothetical protein